MRISFFLFVLITTMACTKEDPMPVENCPVGEAVVSEFQNGDGKMIRIYADGNAYYLSEKGCEFAISYFDPNFDSKTFNRTDSGVYFIVDANTYFAPIRDVFLDFEGITNALELFRLDISQNDLFLTNFTLQSPSAPTVNDYVALQNCLLSGSCDFIDNQFMLAVDPSNIDNTVMEFYSVEPDADMVTSKASMITTLTHFEKGDDFWFEAKYYVKDQLPTTLADFESSYFTESPGPRIIFRGNQLAIENKFGEKLEFNQPEATAMDFPIGEWVTVKVHLTYDESSGTIQLWQNDELLIDETGPNMPFSFWIQNRVEFGITANQETCTLYLDDVRFSDQEF